MEQVQEELGLEQGSKLAEFKKNDFSALDFRIPADSQAITMQCYPQRTIPGVQLGTLE